MKKLMGFVITVLIGSVCHAQSNITETCAFSTAGGAALTCGMSKTQLLEAIGNPLFVDGAGSNSAQGEGENLVFRLTNNAGKARMVSVKLVGDSVQNIIVSQ